MALGAISRSVGGTVNFLLPTVPGNLGTSPAGVYSLALGMQPVTRTITTSNGNDATGILGGWATVNGSTWARQFGRQHRGLGLSRPTRPTPSAAASTR